MRGAALAVLVMLCVSANAASGDAREAPLELVGLRSIAGWLKAQGTEGYVGADLAQALGIAPANGSVVDARQRGFRNAEALRIAQLLPDGSMLFMVQAAGEVTFYHSTAKRGLVRALLSIPGRGMVLPLGGAESESGFRAEVLYWEDKAANR
jgi:hypothetical protein